MKNHIVSQMIIKRFANAINIYDLISGKIDLKKKPNKVFYKENFLSPDLEQLLSTAIESRFANLLNGKLNDGVITLTRDELTLIKRYLLIVSVRSQTPTEFVKMLKSSDDAVPVLKEFGLHSDAKSLNELKLSDKEIYELALRIYCENTSFVQMFADSRITIEMIIWARQMSDSYMAFWDAPNNKEFVLTDGAMINENEGAYSVISLNISKLSYLYYLSENGSDNVRDYISNLIVNNSLMVENFDVFNLSKKRSMVMISPFFRLYFNQKTNFGNNDEVVPTPKCWPTLMENKELFNIPSVKYVVAPGVFSPNDLFTYVPKKLNDWELLYINHFFIEHASELIGYDNPQFVVDAAAFCAFKQANFKSVDYYSITNDNAFAKKFLKDLTSTEYEELLSFFFNINVSPSPDFPINFEKWVNRACEDFKQNKYIYHYLLKNEEQTRQIRQLDFLGNAEERIIYLRKRYKELWGKEWNV